MKTKKRGNLVNALHRRERGSTLANDHKRLRYYVEEKTAHSCRKEKNCELSGSPRSTFLICFSHDRSKMASTHGDHTIRVINSYTGQFIRTLHGHPRTPWCISFHPSNNNLLASGCLGGEVRIWDLMGGCEVYTPPERAVIASIAFHPIDQVLLIATSNKIYFWQWDQPHPFICLKTNYLEAKVRLIKFSPFGDYILTGITNCSHLEQNTDQSSTEATVDQVLQSVSCTQLDSDQVTEYIMQQTRRARENGSNGGASSQSETTQNQAVGPRQGPSAVNASQNTRTPVAIEDADAGPLPSRNYRGVFALFRAREMGWTMDTDVVEPTDVSGSNVLFSSNATESMSIEGFNSLNRGNIQENPEPSTSTTTGGTTGNPDGINRDVSDELDSRRDLTSSSALQTSTFNASTWSSSMTSSSNLPSSSSSSSSFASSSSSSSSISSTYSDNTSSLANILQDDQNLDSPSLSATREVSPASQSSLQDGLMGPTVNNESVFRAMGNDDISQSISILPMTTSSQDNDVTLSMTSSDVVTSTTDTRPSNVSIDTGAMETANADFRRRNVRSSGVNVQIGSPAEESTETGQDGNERLVSGVGSVVNVGGMGGVSSRTSYVAHGQNHSSSLSTLSHNEGSGTAIATATARTFRHVHTAVVIANGNEGGPQIALRTAINRAIAGAFAGSGEGAVASNIINTTHRLQWWDFSKCTMPDIKNPNVNVIVPCCKIHNDASCDLSSDGTLLAAFVPSALGFPDNGMLAIHSMKKETLGQCLFTKKFGPNAISISISPLNSHVVVGLAARRIHWHLTSQQMVAQVYKLTVDNENTDGHCTELKAPVQNIFLDNQDADRRSYVSVNATFWHPEVGCGLVYGTNRGDLRIRQYVSQEY